MNPTSRVRPFVRRGLRAVSGGVRSAGAGRFRLGDVPVPCCRSRSPPRLLGGSFGAFSVDFGRAQHHLRGRVVFVGGTGGLGLVVDKRKCRVYIFEVKLRAADQGHTHKAARTFTSDERSREVAGPERPAQTLPHGQRVF